MTALFLANNSLNHSAPGLTTQVGSATLLYPFVIKFVLNVGSVIPAPAKVSSAILAVVAVSASFIASLSAVDSKYLNGCQPNSKEALLKASQFLFLIAASNASTLSKSTASNSVGLSCINFRYLPIASNPWL